LIELFRRPALVTYEPPRAA